jgi:ribonuclease Z
MFPLMFQRVPESEQHVVIDTPDLRVRTSPVRHLLPNIGLRMEFPALQKTVVYSSDTRPCREVVALAQGADVLIHEASGEHKGHTSAAQAGEIARQAGAKSLWLIHYPTWEQDPTPLVEEARRTFEGEVTLAQDGEEIRF